MTLIKIVALVLLALILTGLAVAATKNARTTTQRFASGVAATAAGVAWGGVLFLAT